MRLLISAGEASGDLHGAHLLAALRRERPDLNAFGMGGERLAEAGLERVVTSESLSVVGISEVVEKLPALRAALKRLDTEARQRRPDAAVLIDFPDFHSLLSRRLARARIPIVYYVPPQVWAWRPARARTIARRARRILTLFSFETEIFQRLGADAVCVGHPVVEDVRQGLAAPSPLPPKTRRRLVLLPGSRGGELARHWEAMAEGAARLARRFDLEVVAVRAPGLPESLFPRAAERGIRVAVSGLHPLLASADLAFVASGTATLEAALCGVPMVVGYRTSAFSHAIARALVRLQWISLVNIVAGREVVTELLQDALNPENLEREGAALLESPERAAAMKAELGRVAAELGPPGASQRAAEEILAALRRSSGLTTDVFPCGPMKPLPRLLSYFRRHRARALMALLAMAVVAAATVALLFLLQQVIDDVLGAGASRSLPGVSAAQASPKTAPLLRWLEAGYSAGVRAAASAGIPPRFAIPLLLLAALLVKNVFAYLSEFALNSIGLAMVRDLRRDAYASLLGQSTRFSSERSSGDLMTRLLADAEQIQTAFGSRMADFVQGILTMLLVLVYVFSLNFRLALAVLVVAPLVVVPIAANFRRFRRQWLSARERIGEMGSILGETLRGHSLIKTYAMEDFEAARFDEANRRYFGAIRQSIRLQALNSPLMEILAGVGLSIIFIYAAGQIRAGLMTVGGLMSFLAAILMMYKPLKDVTRTNIVLQMALASADRIFEVVDAENEIVEKPGARALAPFSGAIAYENVSFAYGQEPVLTDIDLTIRRGETVALVGPSGAGKTTLVGLLSRLYDPTAGRITLDGVDLRDAKLDSLRRQIGLVTQETILFDTTVRQNIAYGETAPAEERVRAAAAAACADEFIERLPNGYDTAVGEGASRLSGGQRQRLAIARAIYKDAPILILDEATSQLDTESEALIARALTNLMRGRTTLVIAHRLSTVRRADRILVLDGGRIVEQGPHAELLTRRGVYRRLHDMQYFAESETSPSTASAPPHLVP